MSSLETLSATTAPAIPVLYIDDEIEILQMYKRELALLGIDLTIAQTSQQGLILQEKEPFPVILLDMKMPGPSGQEILERIKSRWPFTEVLVYTGFGDMDMAIRALRTGAYHFLTKPIKLAELEIQLKQAYTKYLLQQENQVLRRLVHAQDSYEIIGESPALKRVFSSIEKVAPTNSSVLIEGEAGTGKELVARAIHLRSKRSHHPFVVVHCSGLHEQTLENELFGYRSKESLPGFLNDKIGLLEAAHRGTLFLDEVGDLSPSIQVNLLRVLQNQAITSLGSSSSKPIDLRVIAATNRDLEKLVSEERFRGDLYYRLKVIPIQLPPLRERKEDIPLLVDYFMKKKIKIGNVGPKEFTPNAMKALMEYHWPKGNIRELENVLERLMILSSGTEITVEDLKKWSLPNHKQVESHEIPWLSLKNVEKQHITKVLEFCEGNKSRAAKILEITPKTLYNKLTEFKQQENHEQ
ncbi:MAG: sigma-54 dependent transcriptional regulator [Planctomycetota bacterium]|mgnify:CR=1 FL=1